MKRKSERRLQDDMHRSGGRPEALLRTAARLNRSSDLRTLLRTICKEAAGALNLPVAAIALHDQKKDQLRLVASVGLSETAASQIERMPLAWFRQQEGQAREPVLVPDLQQLEETPLSRALADFRVRTLAFVALRYRQKPLGLLLVGSLNGTRQLNDEDLALMRGLADQAAQAVTNARLFRALRTLLQRAQRQARRQQHIVESVPDGLVLLDASRRVLMANSAARRMLDSLAPGYTDGVPLAQIGDHDLETILAETSGGSNWLEIEAPAEQSPEEPRPNGMLIFELTARAVEDEADEARWILVIRDVTVERQRREVAESQDRLATVGQLAAGIAHDFNNIMAIITLYSQTLERTPDFPKRQEYLATISQQAQHASDLIVQILDFSRRAVIEQGRLDLLPFPKEMIKLLQRTLPENIMVTLRAEPGEYLVEADPSRLRQALMNLALNARDAMPAGGELQVSLNTVTLHDGERAPIHGISGGRYMCLSVADTGQGIPAADMPHLFEPFFTTKHTGKGTGIGLAQVYGIVKQHGGEIEVDSSPGQGARFTLYLPALQPAPAAVPASRIPQPVDAGGLTVLLVEDHEPTREAIADTLALLGYKVLIATNGREALDVFDENATDIALVLTDMVMPVMGGVELYRRLMARDLDLKMMVMTGYPLEDEGRSLLEQGIVDWILKPFSPDALGARLSALLAR